MRDIIHSRAFAEVLRSPPDLTIGVLLSDRCRQLLAASDRDQDMSEIAHFIIVEPGDTVAMIERAAGYPVVTASAFEWVARRDAWYEAVTILSDDGFAIVLLVPDSEDIPAELLSQLREALPPYTLAR